MGPLLLEEEVEAVQVLPFLDQEEEVVVLILMICHLLLEAEEDLAVEVRGDLC